MSSLKGQPILNSAELWFLPTRKHITYVCVVNSANDVQDLYSSLF